MNFTARLAAALGIVASQIEAQLPVRPECSPSAVEAVSAPMRQCVASAAMRLERSGERAESVATAVIVACDARFRAIRAQEESCAGYERARTVDTMVRDRAREAAIAKVVEIRAMRRGR